MTPAMQEVRLDGRSPGIKSMSYSVQKHMITSLSHSILVLKFQSAIKQMYLKLKEGLGSVQVLPTIWVSP